MALERVLETIVEGLANPDISPEHAEVLRKMRAVYDAEQKRQRRAEKSIAFRERLTQKREKIVEEARATTGERIGVPIGKFLAETGVTTGTPILEVARSTRPVHGIGLFGLPRLKGGVISGLELRPSDMILAVRAFNALREQVFDPNSRRLTIDSVMGDIATNFDSEAEGVGPHLEAILRTVAEQLPPPPVAAGE